MAFNRDLISHMLFRWAMHTAMSSLTTFSLMLKDISRYVCQACINSACTIICILIQIADFGTCSRVDDNGYLVNATNVIGTPGIAGTQLYYHTVLDLFHTFTGYVSPEVGVFTLLVLRFVIPCTIRCRFSSPKMAAPNTPRHATGFLLV